MKLIIGLGNPTPEYSATRHNAGFLVVDALKEKIQNSKSETLNKRLHHFVGKIQIFKSDKFMNESGVFVKQLMSKYPNVPVSSIYVIHDDLDIPLGSYKIQFGRGPRDHNGIKSVDEAFGTSQYWHIRIGVDNRPADNRPMGEEYVLQNFTDEERVILDKTIKEVCKKLAISLRNTN